MAGTDWDGSTFEAHRPLLFSIAYRMLGSASEAEDVVQDAWLRARQDEHADIRSVRAYLTTIVTRLCIDHLRSAERTRMEYPGPWLPEPLAEPNQESADLAGSLTTAFLVLLEQLGALGYVSGAVDPSAIKASGADPKDKILEFRRANQGMRDGLLALNRREYAAAADQFGALLDNGIESFEAHLYLGRALAGLKRFDRAAPHFEHAQSARR